jgi:hypothetical protein
VCCFQPIEAGYLREIGTHLTYCDRDCYADHCKSAFVLLEKQATASCALASRTSRALGQNRGINTLQSKEGQCDESL